MDKCERCGRRGREKERKRVRVQRIEHAAKLPKRIHNNPNKQAYNINVTNSTVNLQSKFIRRDRLTMVSHVRCDINKLNTNINCDDAD